MPVYDPAGATPGRNGVREIVQSLRPGVTPARTNMDGRIYTSQRETGFAVQRRIRDKPLLGCGGASQDRPLMRRHYLSRGPLTAGKAINSSQTRRPARTSADSGTFDFGPVGW